jgi:hypothetical protein
MSALRSLVVALLCLAGMSAHARAQETDVHAAAAAFEEGQRAQLRGDFAQAADLFEIADRSAPNPAALRSAIRNLRAAGRSARAATLASEARVRYPDDAETSALATEILTALAPALARVAVHCDLACEVTLDARAVVEHTITTYELYVDPGEHTVVASWTGRGAVHRELDAQAGSEAIVDLTAPPPRAEPEHHEAIADAAPPPPPPSSGVHPALFGTLTGLALVGIGLTIWSGIDVVNAAADYRADPTHARYDDGIGRELRTNVLTSVSAALAIAAFVSVFFTDWDDINPGPDESIALVPSFYATHEGGGGMITGRYAP